MERPYGEEGPFVTSEPRPVYAVVAEFDDAERVVAGARRVREAGYRRIDAYSPFPVEGLPEACGFRDHYVPWLMLIAGILGGLAGFGLLYWTLVIEYPLNVGGRPSNPANFGWPHFIPITFEMTVLTCALVGVVGMFMLNGLPRPHHPIFDAPNFDRASSDRFFLAIETADEVYREDPAAARRLLDSLGALRVSEVEERE